MTAQTVADKITTEFISLLGVPKQLHSDQGRQFEAHLFQEVCRLLGIKKTRTTPCRPQSDGMVERFNRTIQQMLKHFVNENRDDWDDHLPYLTMAYRSSVHESTGCTPNLLMLGRELPMPLDILVGQPEKQAYNCPIEYVEWLQYSMTTAYEYARLQLRKAAVRQKRCYDLTAKETEFSPGKFAWRWYPPKANQKLGKGWTGPFRVMKCPNDVNVVIRYKPEDNDIRVHIDHLKPYLGEVPELWENFPQENPNDSTNQSIITDIIAEQIMGPNESSEEVIEIHDPPEHSFIQNELTEPTSTEVDENLQISLPTTAKATSSEVIRRSKRQRKPPDKLDL